MTRPKDLTRLSRLRGISTGRMFATAIGLGSATLLSVACGTESPVPPVDFDRSLYPLAPGNRWQYRIQEADQTEKTKTLTVSATVGPEGSEWMQVRIEKTSKHSVAVEHFEDGRALRTSEDNYDGDLLTSRLRFAPSKLRIDTSAAEVGATYVSTFSEEHLSLTTGTVERRIEKIHTFTVEALDEAVTVPAGTFRTVRILRQTGTPEEGGIAKRFWFAPRVGKVKEVGGQLEELSEFELRDALN